MRSRFHDNTARLFRLILRRERVMTPVWLISLLFVTLMVPVAFSGMYSTPMDRFAMAITMKNPAMIAMVGPVYGEKNYTMGAMIANEMVLFTLLAVALMNIFFVIRHTRRDEERGRVEVIRSLPVGRLSTLSAALGAACAVNALLALFTGLGLWALGVESMGFAGSMLYGAALGVTGLFFAAVAALFAQLCVSSRGAVGYACAALGVLYLLRAVGDINSEALARVSPLGLILRTQIYVQDLWWPVWIVLAESAVVAAAAFSLNAVRDMDQGFIPARRGRASASPLLRSPLGLSLRLLRGMLIGWAIGLFVLGASYGSIMGDLETFLDTNALFRQLLPTSPSYSTAELFLTILMSVMAIAATIPALSAVLKLRGEEKRNHTEHVLSRAVSRTRLMAGYYGIAMVCSVVMLLLTTLGLWSACSAVMDTPIALRSLLKAMMVYLPALWVMIGVATLLVGLWPERASWAWIYLGVSMFVVYLGKLLQFPIWAQRLSPFGSIPQLPLDPIRWPTLLLLTAIAALLSLAGFAGLKRRDMQG